jgi:hypothetical protein
MATVEYLNRSLFDDDDNDDGVVIGAGADHHLPGCLVGRLGRESCEQGRPRAVFVGTRSVRGRLGL